MSRLTDLVEQVARRDQTLGEELRREVAEYAKRRSFGLNFERHSPEGVRLWGRPPRVGDVVNALPPRGAKEGPGSGSKWLVEAVDERGRVAHLSSLESDGEAADAPLDDLVVFSDFGRPIYPGLRETGRVERGGDRPYQVVINGENYHALETLLYAYEGKVDCIYADPPYNTGARDWKYNNDYVDSNDQYRHSKWLAFMERRLKLAKRLLNPEDSVLICTIDEKEYLRLGLLLEQTFSDATIQMISSVVNPKGVAQKNGFRRADEYLFFVMIGSCGPLMLPLDGEWSASSRKSAPARAKDRKAELGWTSMMRRGSSSRRADRPGLFYPIYADPQKHSIALVGEPLPDGVDRAPELNSLVQILPIRADGTQGRWQIGPEELRTRVKQGRIRLGSATSYGYVVNYLPDGEYSKLERGLYRILGHADDGSLLTESVVHSDETMAPTQWKIASHNASEYGTGTLRALTPGRKFPFPKSLYAVEDCLRFFVANKPDALIVDFFCGSGTTAHAVMRLNHQDGGHRRCVCVTNNEVSDEEARRLTKQGHRPGDPEWERLGICEYVTKPRVTAAITGRTPVGEPIKGDYKFTDEFPMADGFEENAVFYDLTYQDELAVGLDMAFEEIAPILWLRAGATGRCISRRLPGYDVADTYAVLFDYAHAREFLSEVAGHDGLRVVYVVTDQDSRFQDVARRLPEGVEPVRLYESYLRSFRINGGEA